jgi:erythromycin esterase-like protein
MSRRTSEPEVSDALLAEVRALARPLRTDADLDPLLARVGDARVVLLGEASHGTSEFYTWRARITRRLVEEKGFNFVAVEGDWPDCYAVNRFVKGYAGAAPTAAGALAAFRRWPTWMWANREVEELAGWLADVNRGRPDGAKVGFYGLDVYSLWDSLRAVVRHLTEHHPHELEAGRRAVRCFEPYADDAQDYARATVLLSESCRNEAVNLLLTLRATAAEHKDDGGDAHFVAEQNALVVKNAEAYYRAMVRSDSGSWNVRDRHMAETLDRLLAHHGPGAKAVVWEHNTHVGDARFTDMAESGEVNIGQLARERFGDAAVLVGFGTYEGAVIAGTGWGEPWEEMQVPPGRAGSWEDVLHAAGGGTDELLVFPKEPSAGLSARRGHRAIGVVYRPQYERYGNYVPTVLPRRYDAFLHIDRTMAVRPLFAPTASPEPDEVPETYPSGQ